MGASSIIDVGSNSDIGEYSSPESVALQVPVARALLEDGNIPNQALESPMFQERLTLALGELQQHFDLGHEVIDSLKKGERVVLDDKQKEAFMEKIFSLMDINETSINKQIETFDDIGNLKENLSWVKSPSETIFEALRRASMFRSKVSLIGNAIQIEFDSKVGLLLFNLRNGIISEGGTCFQLPLNIKDIYSPVYSENLVLSLSSKREKTIFMRAQSERKHEAWHVFDRIKKLLSSKKHVEYDQEKFPVSLEEVKKSFYDLDDKLPVEFRNLYFKLPLGILAYGLKEGLRNVQPELTAYIAGFFKDEEDFRIEPYESKWMVNTIIGKYLLGGAVDLDKMRTIANDTNNGRIDSQTYRFPHIYFSLMASLINGYSAHSGNASPTEKAALKYYTDGAGETSDRKINIKGSERVLKTDKGKEIVDHYTILAKFFFDPSTSPIAVVVRDLEGAIAAFNQYSPMVGKYEALVDLSSVPYNKWKEYVESKQKKS